MRRTHENQPDLTPSNMLMIQQTPWDLPKISTHHRLFPGTNIGSTIGFGLTSGRGIRIWALSGTTKELVDVLKTMVNYLDCSYMNNGKKVCTNCIWVASKSPLKHVETTLGVSHLDAAPRTSAHVETICHLGQGPDTDKHLGQSRAVPMRCPG